MRPVLDIMQTTPTFVYLVPVVMLFGVGTVPGEVAVITAAAPPLIRFTNLGIRMVDHEMVEAGLAFGADRRQLLWEVQLPLAMPTILGGLNQTVLTAMVMSVVVAMIGAEGLGLVVLQGLGRLDVGRAAVGGIAIVLLGHDARPHHPVGRQVQGRQGARRCAPRCCAWSAGRAPLQPVGAGRQRARPDIVPTKQQANSEAHHGFQTGPARPDIRRGPGRDPGGAAGCS